MATRKSGGLGVQAVNHLDGRRSFVIRGVTAGLVHSRVDKCLAPFGEGTQRTYGYYLVDHLCCWRGRGWGGAVDVAELGRYMALCRTEQRDRWGLGGRDDRESQRVGGASGLFEV